MRAYLVEDIYDDNAKKIVNALIELGLKGPIEGIFYLPVPEKMLEKEQHEHLKECGPYMMALEDIDNVGDTHVFKLELLVRARKHMRCSCITYATPAQREHMINYLDDFIRDLDIVV